MNRSVLGGTGLSAQEERAITALLIAYATAIDRRDWKLFETLFSSDCDVDYGSFGKWSCAQALTAFMKEAHSDVGPTLHRITNIEIHASDDDVFATSYVGALLTSAIEGGPTHRGVGSYEDRLTRTGTGWQIAHRRFRALVIE